MKSSSKNSQANFLPFSWSASPSTSAGVADWSMTGVTGKLSSSCRTSSCDGCGIREEFFDFGFDRDRDGEGDCLPQTEDASSEDGLEGSCDDAETVLSIGLVC